MSGVVGGAREAAGGLFTAQAAWIAAYLVQDLARWDLAREGRAIADREEQQRLRDAVLARLEVQRSFSAGSVLVNGADGRPDLSPVVAVVTPDEVVLLDADVASAPEREVARIPRDSIRGVRLLDQHGEPVPGADLDAIAELDAPRDRRFVVWVDRPAEDGGGANGFVFLSATAARDCAGQFDRLVAGA